MWLAPSCLSILLMASVQGVAALEQPVQVDDEEDQDEEEDEEDEDGAIPTYPHDTNLLSARSASTREVWARTRFPDGWSFEVIPSELCP